MLKNYFCSFFQLFQARGIAKGIEQKSGSARDVLKQFEFPNWVFEEMSRTVGFNLALAKQVVDIF